MEHTLHVLNVVMLAGNIQKIPSSARSASKQISVVYTAPLYILGILKFCHNFYYATCFMLLLGSEFNIFVNPTTWKGSSLTLCLTNQ